MQSNDIQISIDAAYATSYRVTINTNPDTFSTCIDFLSPSSHIFGPGEDSVSVQVEATDDCDWSARSNAAWIRVTAGDSSGPGRASYTVTRNPHPTSRTGTLTIGGWTITVTQVGTHHLLFADDLESGTEGWVGAASWALTTASARSGARAWGWQYQGESNTSLWSPVIDLTEVESATLTFWHRFNFTGDGVSRVWVAPQNGQPGTEIKRFTGAQGWTQVSLDLSPFVGQSITLAFNMFGTTNAADSWYIDDVAVFTAGPVGYDVCTHAVSPTRQVFGPREGVASVRVEALPGCHWGATSNSPWLQITTGSSGSGPGRVSYAFAANPHSTARIGTLTVGGQTLTVIQAGANENLFEDDMESGTNGWSVNAPWALTTASARSGTHAWTDSPGGNYQNNQRATLWSPWTSIIDLTSVNSATLTFWHRYDFGKGDVGSVWVAREKEEGSWAGEAVLRRFTGTSPTWQQTSLDLTPFVGARIRLVFQFISDASETADGWYIDDVAVFSSDFETPAPDPDYCRDYGPCSAGQGDCDPGQCTAGLICTNDVGAQYGLPAHYDVCEARGSGQPDPDYCVTHDCGVGQGDCDPGQCAAGLICTNDVGAQYGLPAHYDVCEARGSGQPDPDYCVTHDCGVGQGDCDPGQCAAGLICTNDVGAQYGLPAHYDVCEVPSGGRAGVPDPHLCRDYGPCGVGQGDCDPGQCGAGLVCAADVGPQYGLPAIYDVCEVPSGSAPPAPDPDYCRDYGPCGVGQGDCDPGQCAFGLVCAADVGPQYGLPAIYDVCEVPRG